MTHKHQCKNGMLMPMFAGHIADQLLVTVITCGFPLNTRVMLGRSRVPYGSLYNTLPRRRARLNIRFFCEIRLLNHSYKRKKQNQGQSQQQRDSGKWMS